MFTKALIVETPKRGDNIYKVRIPIFEDTTGTEIVYDALCCYAPGVFNGLNPGDCVYVAFEDAKLNIPVIIGRLYTEEQDDYSKGYFNNLLVTNTARLPMNTKFDNWLSIKELSDTIQYISSQINQCQYDPGDIYSSSVNTNPATKWPGTTWANHGNITTATGNIIYNWRRVS